MRKLTHEEYEQKLFEREASAWPLELYAGNKIKILHECIIGHTWSVAPSNVIAGHGCPICTGKGSKTNDQYLQQLKENDIIYRPLEPYKTALEPIIHECPECSFQWSVCPSAIINNRTGCPKCSVTGFNPGRPATLYYIKIGKYYKLGITNKSIPERFKADSDKEIIILWQKHFENGTNARQKEQEIIKQFQTCDVGKYLKSGGNTELFDWDILQMENKQ